MVIMVSQQNEALLVVLHGPNCKTSLEQLTLVVLWFAVRHEELGFAQMWWRRDKDGGSGGRGWRRVCGAHVCDLTTIGLKQH